MIKQTKKRVTNCFWTSFPTVTSTFKMVGKSTRIFLSRRENQLTFERPLSWLLLPIIYLLFASWNHHYLYYTPFIHFLCHQEYTHIHLSLHRRSFCTDGCDARWLYLLKSTWHELSKCFSLDKNSTLCQWNFILLYFKV